MTRGFSASSFAFTTSNGRVGSGLYVALGGSGSATTASAAKKAIAFPISDSSDPAAKRSSLIDPGDAASGGADLARSVTAPGSGALCHAPALRTPRGADLVFGGDEFSSR